MRREKGQKERRKQVDEQESFHFFRFHLFAFPICARVSRSLPLFLSRDEENKGLLVAVENKKRRLEALKNNIQRMGATNTVVYEMTAVDVGRLNVKFDKVLLDAPCSGNYYTDSEWFDKRDLEGIQKNAKRQRKLMKAAYDVLKKDGILLYSTCSLEPEENEMNVQWMMDNFNVKLENVETTMGVKGLTTIFNNKLRPVISKTRRFWPGETQGFFIAKIRKTAD